MDPNFASLALAAISKQAPVVANTVANSNLQQQ